MFIKLEVGVLNKFYDSTYGSLVLSFKDVDNYNKFIDMGNNGNVFEIRIPTKTKTEYCNLYDNCSIVSANEEHLKLEIKYSRYRPRTMSEIRNEKISNIVKE
jgi:hypothetical protein